MAYGEIRPPQVSARMLPSTGSIAGGTLGLRFRADGKLLVVLDFSRPLVDTGEVRWWMAKCVVDRSGRHRIDSGGRLPEQSVGRISAFGSARTHGSPRELCSLASHLSSTCSLRSDDTDADLGHGQQRSTSVPVTSGPTRKGRSLQHRLEDVGIALLAAGRTTNA